MYCFFVDYTYETSPGSNYYNGINYWKYKTKGAIYSSPIATAGRVIFGSNDFHLYCLDTTIDVLAGRATPQAIWIDSTFNEIVSSPCVSNQVVYVGSKDYYLYAFNMRDGHLKWQFKTNGLVKSSPLAYNGMVYIASYDKYLYAIDSATGTQKWSQNVNGSIECSPAIDDLTGRNQINSTISGFSRGWAP
jgi:outer membrane protein assembly factor BamB